MSVEVYGIIYSCISKYNSADRNTYRACVSIVKHEFMLQIIQRYGTTYRIVITYGIYIFYTLITRSE